MYELSLHILDLMENSIRAGASLISVTVEADPAHDTMALTIEDNGPGLQVCAQAASDPFYTTKNGKRTGLGLSFLQAAVEQAGGRFSLGRSSLGGLSVEATMGLSHVDRSPLGDIASTVSSVVCTNPDLDVWCNFRMAGRESVVRVSDVVSELPVRERGGLAVARRVGDKIKAELAAIKLAP